ncbi:MAG: hypothetical protein D6728_04820 [Cyanobacteria bacterium J055]|nr:MAG: hypothetical protein D6728_04820 [Cyanobacteria bacterium J055]
MNFKTLHGTLLTLGLAMATPLGLASFHARAEDNPTPLAAEAAAESAEIQFARYLTESDVEMFGTFWCPHSQHQRERFGEEAFQLVEYIECDPRGENARPRRCEEEGIRGYPTWKINSQLYPGDRSLEELAELSGYEGSRNFAPTEP